MLEYEEIFEGYKQYFNGDERRAEYEARRILEVLDLNQNGAIEYSEFLIANIDPKKLIREDRLREVFDMFDVDHSGAITVDEIKQILGGAMGKAEKQPVNPQQLTIKTQEMPRGGIEPQANLIDDDEWNEILGEVDANGDGEISFEEFVEMIFKLFNLNHEDVPITPQASSNLKKNKKPLVKSSGHALGNLLN